jgi:hypothetical protein
MSDGEDLHLGSEDENIYVIFLSLLGDVVLEVWPITDKYRKKYIVKVCSLVFLCRIVIQVFVLHRSEILLL